MFGVNIAPCNWAFCDGQLLQISTNSTVFFLLGTTFGGDGRYTFGLPDLRGRVAIHPGAGPGLPAYQLGQKGGTNIISGSNLPAAHTHGFSSPCHSGAPNESSPAGSFPTNSAATGEDLYDTTSNDSMGSGTTGSAGNNSEFFVPYLGINYIFALVGTFPPRN
jgi:microcystin-dependent protein